MMPHNDGITHRAIVRQLTTRATRAMAPNGVGGPPDRYMMFPWQRPPHKLGP